ncbi:MULTISPECIES: hypothetical protein [Kribbella]|uniref:Peptidase inhibitor family I36 n=1 Tax=Kribbella karoonensis TaxID=324851 RepID=A0ABN2E759_9ACTN
MRKFLTAAVVLGAAAILPTGAAGAAATPSRPAAQPTVQSVQTMLSSGWKSGCNFKTCVYARYNGHGWDAFGGVRAPISYGHLDVFGPDHVTHHSGGDRSWQPGDASTTFHGTGLGRICAQGWYRYPDNHYVSQGLACVEL